MIRPTTTHIVLCSSETTPSEDIGLKELDSQHRQRGWFKCLYHFVIRRDGTIEHGLRKYQEPAMGLKHHNAYSVSVCIVGGKGEPPIEQEQILSTRDLIKELLDEYPGAKVVNHHELILSAPVVDLAKHFTNQQGATNG